MDIANIRRQYGTDQLHKEDLDSDPTSQFKLWLSQAIESNLSP